MKRTRIGIAGIVGTVVLIAVMALSVKARAQDPGLIVRGKLVRTVQVNDSTTQQVPVANVAVTLKDRDNKRSEMMITDASGMYYFRNPQLGNYTLEVWRSGVVGGTEKPVTYQVNLTRDKVKAPQAMATQQAQRSFIDIAAIELPASFFELPDREQQKQKKEPQEQKTEPQEVTE